MGVARMSGCGNGQAGLSLTNHLRLLVRCVHFLSNVVGHTHRRLLAP